MNTKSDLENKSIRKILKPAGIVFILFTYTLGISAARYLGGKIVWWDALTGLIICLLIRDMRNFLAAYFDHPESYQSTINRSDPDWENLINIRRGVLLLYSLLTLTAGATLTTVLIVRGVFNLSSIILLGIAFLLKFFSATPTLFLLRKGYEELVDALYVANLVPAIAFSLVMHSPSLLIVELTLPLTFVYLAMKIAIDFKTYGFDSSHGRPSLTTLLGWQKALVIHNLFILLAFVFLSLFLLSGLPWSLTWPPLLALPIGILQIVHLQNIANGAKPKWRYLNWLAVGAFLLMSYLIIISLWL